VRATAGAPGIVRPVQGEHPLLRLLRPLDPLEVDDPRAPGERLPDAAIRCAAGSGDPEWLRCDGWQVLATPAVGAALPGDRLARFVTAAGASHDAVVDRSAATAHIPFSLAEAYETYVRERWAGAASGRRLSEGTLDRFYRVKRLIPRRAQLAARRALVRWQGRPAFPAWPFDDSVARLLKLLVAGALAASGERELRFRWFWPTAGAPRRSSPTTWRARRACGWPSSSPTSRRRAGCAPRSTSSATRIRSIAESSTS
jgi:hypothetical protein